MKTTINRAELIKLGACRGGLDTFTKAHGTETVTFSEALASNGITDVLYMLRRGKEMLSPPQNDDLRIFAQACADRAKAYADAADAADAAYAAERAKQAEHLAGVFKKWEQ
jgi:hypothetical protein